MRIMAASNQEFRETAQMEEEEEEEDKEEERPEYLQWRERGLILFFFKTWTKMRIVLTLKDIWLFEKLMQDVMVFFEKQMSKNGHIFFFSRLLFC